MSMGKKLERPLGDPGGTSGPEDAACAHRPRGLGEPMATPCQSGPGGFGGLGVSASPDLRGIALWGSQGSSQALFEMEKAILQSALKSNVV